MRRLLPVAALVLLLPAPTIAQTSRLIVELEGGPVWQSYNDVEVPNDGTATRFALDELAGTGPWPAGRLYLTWNLSDRHGLRALVAPFSLTETGTPAEPIGFAGADYAAGEPVEATYTFNSYRLTYRYRVLGGDRSTAWIGLTAKIRDATIALEQGPTSSRKDDVGFVPLLHLAGDWYFAPDWRLRLDADGLAGGPGRAIDAALKLGYDVDRNWTVSAGYRTLEGGADVEEVYAFAWLHYLVGSVSYRW
ncbi:MAG TPA: hypothetical protein VFT28_08125 [Gemmatimonadales bacterium]|nr:hypothetical protein [Gemmatimonadales bacterium]